MVDPGVDVVRRNIDVHGKLSLHPCGKLQGVGSRYIGSKRLHCLTWHDGRVGKRILKVERAGGRTGHRVLYRGDAIERLLSGGGLPPGLRAASSRKSIHRGLRSPEDRSAKEAISRLVCGLQRDALMIRVPRKISFPALCQAEVATAPGLAIAWRESVTRLETTPVDHFQLQCVP